MTNRFGAVAAVYVGGLLIGLNLVSFPSSSAYLVDRLNLTGEQYGSIYLPQLVLAIVGALGGGFAVRFINIKTMYVLSVLSFMGSQLAFAMSVRTDPSQALPLLMFSTALFGFGFGFGGGPVNGLASALFSKHRNSAVTLLHMSAGAGLTLGPLIFNAAIQAGNWSYIPVSLAGLAALLFVVTSLSKLPMPPDAPVEASAMSPSKSAYFWLIMLVAVFYALVEGAFANWAIIYVQDTKSLSPQIAATSLAAFWGALTAGRLAATLLLVRIPAFTLWISLPPLMAAALFALPFASGDAQVILGFAFAGLACSAFFPLMVAVAAEPYPHAISYIASMLTAALMFGVGIGSYVIGRFINDISLDLLYQYSMAYPIIAFLLIIISRKTLKQK